MARIQGSTRAPRHRTVLEWDERRDRVIREDLARFRTRALGRRVRELLVMGLAAERLGMRVEEREGELVAVAPKSWDLVPVHALISGNGETPTPANHGPDTPEMDPDHEAGLLELLNSMGVG